MSIPPGWRVDESIAATAPIVRIAVGEIGEHEEGMPNRGPRVDLYTGMIGRPLGEPGPRWCVAFVRWCYRRAGLDFPSTSSVEGLRDWGERHGRLVHRGALLPGDVFCILTDGPRGDEHHHAGLVVADLGDGRAATVEGNHGNRVAAVVRRGGEFTAIVRVAG